MISLRAKSFWNTNDDVENAGYFEGCTNIWQSIPLLAEEKLEASTSVINRATSLVKSWNGKNGTLQFSYCCFLTALNFSKIFPTEILKARNYEIFW